MVVWKIELGPLPQPQARVRVIVEADFADHAIAAARQRHPAFAERGCGFQAMCSAELAYRSLAEQIFLEHGFNGWRHFSDKCARPEGYG